MNGALTASDTTASLPDTRVQMVPLFLTASLLGLLVLVGEILVFVLFPFGALGYGVFCLARHLKNRLLK